jgi:hypothetical protein
MACVGLTQELLHAAAARSERRTQGEEDSQSHLDVVVEIPVQRTASASTRVPVWLAARFWNGALESVPTNRELIRVLHGSFLPHSRAQCLSYT